MSSQTAAAIAPIAPALTATGTPPSALERRRLGRTGAAVSVLGFGAGPIGYLETEPNEVARLLNRLLDEGVNLIDTAASYRGAEERIGAAVSHRRDQFFLVTKCGPALAGVPGGPWSPETITHTVERALRRLRTDYIDVMLLHSCERSVLERGEAVGALEQARRAGKVRWLGYSGDNEEAAFACSVPDLDVIEVSVNLCDQANLETVLPLARDGALGVIAKRPLANAAWRPPNQQPGLYADYARPYSDRLRHLALNPLDLGLSGDLESAWPELALRFALSHAGVHTAIIGTTQLDNALANLRAAQKGPLPPETVARIRAAFHAAADDSWIGLT